MAFLNIFKKKKEKPVSVKAGVGKKEGKKSREEKLIKKPVKKRKPIEKPEELKKEKSPKIERVKIKEKKTGEAWKILKSPHVTEKATDLVGKNQYIFKVWPRANKTEVKKAIENIFGVDVVGVRIINVPRRKRRLGRREGFRKGYKKAIAKIRKGQKIEVLPR